VYMGVEGALSGLLERITWSLNLTVSVGGWVVDFMVQARNGEPFESGLVPTGFWAGVTIGRLVLGFVNDWLGKYPSTQP
jgi:fucose permease